MSENCESIDTFILFTNAHPFVKKRGRKKGKKEERAKADYRFVKRGSLRGNSNLYVIIYVKWWNVSWRES